MRHQWVSRVDFERMIRGGEITEDASLAAYTLLLLHEHATG